MEPTAPPPPKDRPKRARRRTREELAAAKRADDEARVVLWSESHGAPVRLLVGWDPATGKWHPTSPVGQMLQLIQGANYPSTAAKAVGLSHLPALLAKGNEYLVDAAEDRQYIPIGIRPFVDLVRELDLAEAVSEGELVNVVRSAARGDGKLALAFLSRRHASRWREQQSIFSAETVDERDKAVSEALADPNTALALGAIAHRIEDVAPAD